MRVPGRLAGTMPPSASMCCGIPQPQQNPPQPDKRGERSSSMIACPFWLQLKAGLFSRSSLSKHASQHAWRAAVCPEVTCSRVVRAFNHAVRPQRIPHPRQGVQCVLARRTSGCPSRCCQTPASCCARTFKARDAPCSLPPSLLLAFTAQLGVVVWQCLLWMHRNCSMT